MRGAGVDCVHAHAHGAVGRRHARTHQHQRRIGCAARHVDGAGHLATGAHHVDDGPLPTRAHLFDHQIQHVHVGEELGVHRVVPRLGVQLFGWRAARRASGVDQYVYSTKGGFGRGQGRAGPLRVLQIGGVQMDAILAACHRCAQPLACGFQVLQAA